MDELRDILQRLNARAISEGFRDESDDSFNESDTGCEVCGGRGWYSPNVPVGHPEFGQTVTCRCFEDRLTETKQARLVGYSNLGALTRFTFETLHRNGFSKGSEDANRFNAAYDAALDYASRPEGWLVLTGPHGTGKTHLAAAVSNRLIQNGYSVFFVHVPELLDHLRSAYSPKSETTYDDLFEQVKTTPILVMDELKLKGSTPWAQEKLRQLVNHRYNTQLPTVFTTAELPKEIDPYLRVRIEAQGGNNVFLLGGQTPDSSLKYGSIDQGMLKRMSFDTFRHRYAGLSQESEATLTFALQAARNFAQVPQGWLTLYGDTGTGKTHLAVAIAGEQISQGHSVFFAFMPTLMGQLRYAYEPESDISYMRLLEHVLDAPLLILDAVGEERDSEWSKEIVLQIIRHRHNLRLPTVFTCNADITRRRGPLGSRMQDPSIGSIIPMHAPDYLTRGSNRG